MSTIARARKLFDLRERLVARHEELARSVTTEMGKTIADATAEVARMIEMVEAACAIPTTMQGRILEDVSRNIDAETIRQPVGVCAAIVPFNFPAMVPFWFLPFAIACGNTFVLKPSEQVPLTQQIAFEELDALDLPAGVVNLVNGGREIVEGILDAPGDRRRVVRRLGAGCAARLRGRGQGGQAGAGPGGVRPCRSSAPTRRSSAPAWRSGSRVTPASASSRARDGIVESVDATRIVVRAEGDRRRGPGHLPRSPSSSARTSRPATTRSRSSAPARR